jgi:excisionase family DNA binding protein
MYRRRVLQALLSPRDLGDAIGVSESSVKRWVDEKVIRATRTAGGHRRIAVPDAVQYIRQRRLPILKPQVLGLADLQAVEAAEAYPETDPEVFRQALLAGDAPHARGIVLSTYLAGTPVAELCEGLIAEAMHHIGQLWEHDESGIFLEHRATDICLQALNQLRLVLPEAEDEQLVAVGGAPTSDPYLLPSLMADTVLTSEGWRTTNLGPQTPMNVLGMGAERTAARLVWLSFSTEKAKRGVSKEVLRLADRLAELGARLVVGGRAVPDMLNGAKDNLYVVSSMAELAAFAKGLQGARN